MNDIEKLNKNFSYNPETGEVTRTTRRNSNGSYDKDGYLIFKFNKKQYKAHRLAWFLYYGFFPKNVINHKNGKRDDNKIENLEDVTQAVNSKKGMYKTNKDTGVNGVYIDKTNGLKKKYATKLDGLTYRFYSVEEALQFKKTAYGNIR